MQDMLITDFSTPVFQNAFRKYFAELGINVQDWDGLFREMTFEGGNRAFVRMDANETVVGFIMFKNEKLSNWFFEENIGFIREFWVCEEFRNNGHGSCLLRLAEEYFLGNGIRKAVLTTATAERFYEKHSYFRDDSYTAKNGDAVFIKHLASCMKENNTNGKYI